MKTTTGNIITTISNGTAKAIIVDSEKTRQDNNYEMETPHNRLKELFKGFGDIYGNI